MCVDLYIDIKGASCDLCCRRSATGRFALVFSMVPDVNMGVYRWIDGWIDR